MVSITLNTAMSLTGLSKRTLWRRIADGQLRVHDASSGGGGRSEHTRVLLDDVIALSPLRLDDDDCALIAEADAGSVEAQCDLGLLLLTQNHPSEAVAWLTRGGQPDLPRGHAPARALLHRGPRSGSE